MRRPKSKHCNFRGAILPSPCRVPTSPMPSSTAVERPPTRHRLRTRSLRSLTTSASQLASPLTTSDSLGTSSPTPAFRCAVPEGPEAPQPPDRANIVAIDRGQPWLAVVARQTPLGLLPWIMESAINHGSEPIMHDLESRTPAALCPPDEETVGTPERFAKVAESLLTDALRTTTSTIRQVICEKLII